MINRAGKRKYANPTPRVKRKGKIKTWGDKLSLRSSFSAQYRKISVRSENTNTRKIPDFPSEYSAVKSKIEDNNTPIINRCLLVIKNSLLR